jgi:signal transduction histidine kinase
MPPRQGASIRLWQTELFVVVIMVAILILSGSLSAGLKSTLTAMAKASGLRNAAALARRVEPALSSTGQDSNQLQKVIAEYRGIYGGGIWVYDHDGTLLKSAYDVAPPQAVLDSAKFAGLVGKSRYAEADMSQNGWVVVAQPVGGAGKKRAGVVVAASSVEDSLAILGAVRDRLWITFWVSLIVAGLLGFGFAELIGRRIRSMSDAAAAIAAGDFEQRMPTGFVPYEVRDLAVSYNSMAARLGEAFGAVRESERQIAAVVESMAEGVVSFDSHGAVAVINPEAIRLLAVPDRELVGVPAEVLVADPIALEIIRAGLDGQSAVQTASLGQFTVLLHCTPLLDADGTVEGAVLLLGDVTEQRRIEDAQRRFVADASHELRTPIAALKGILELLTDGAMDDPAVRDDFIRTMQVESDRLSRLVADLLTLARLDAGSLQLNIAPEWASDLLGDVAGVMRTLAERAGVELSVELPDGDLRALADRDRVVQVLLSFTDNALKHSAADSTVHLRARKHDDNVWLEVADEGSGIEPEELSRVFERFYRADVARAGGGGTGLGLAIAKEIVEAHGSAIEVHSTPAQGTTFGFDLPAA